MKMWQPLLLLAAIACFSGSIAQIIPHLITYQGRVTDDLGNPLNGDYLITFTIYGVPEGGDQLWSSGPQAVEVMDGLFTYVLGSMVLIPDSVFMKDEECWLAVGVNGAELAPRKRIVSVPYALHTELAEIAFYTELCENAALADRAINADYAGLSGEAALADTAAFAHNAAESFHSIHADTAVYALTAANNGLALPYVGSVTFANPAFSVTNEGGGAGILGRGINGTTNYGAQFYAADGDTNCAIYADASGGDVNYGLYAEAPTGTNDWAGYFAGDVNITGTLFGGKSATRIDHPFDPENKFLVHSWVASPDMMDIYNGNVVTDERGRATVTLPDYFEALNKNFRYQLTVIGEFAQAIISEEISDNQFGILTDKPYIKVSWQVTGIRNDASRDLPVEMDKPESERSRYPDPQSFGSGEQFGIHYQDRLRRLLGRETGLVGFDPGAQERRERRER